MGRAGLERAYSPKVCLAMRYVCEVGLPDKAPWADPLSRFARFVRPLVCASRAMALYLVFWAYRTSGSK
jgi:hypothetical protein